MELTIQDLLVRQRCLFNSMWCAVVFISCLDVAALDLLLHTNIWWRNRDRIITTSILILNKKEYMTYRSHWATVMLSILRIHFNNSPLSWGFRQFCSFGRLPSPQFFVIPGCAFWDVLFFPSLFYPSCYTLKTSKWYWRILYWALNTSLLRQITWLLPNSSGWECAVLSYV